MSISKILCNADRILTNYSLLEKSRRFYLGTCKRHDNGGHLQ